MEYSKVLAGACALGSFLFIGLAGADGMVAGGSGAGGRTGMKYLKHSGQFKPRRATSSGSSTGWPQSGHSILTVLIIILAWFYRAGKFMAGSSTDVHERD
jgi:hypothetical protein